MAVVLLCAAAGCGSETERSRGAGGKVTASKEERLKGSDRMWAAELGGGKECGVNRGGTVP